MKFTQYFYAMHQRLDWENIRFKWIQIEFPRRQCNVPKNGIEAVKRRLACNLSSPHPWHALPRFFRVTISPIYRRRISIE